MPGPQGLAAAKGDKGDIGLKGDIGAQGAMGDRGYPGEPGLPGIQGLMVSGYSSLTFDLVTGLAACRHLRFSRDNQDHLE